jgi:uncharacterized protein (TIGR00730 family)
LSAAERRSSYSDAEVAVIGSARLGESDPAWTRAAELGRRLVEAGFTVVTGGYGGLMQATAHAAHAAGGKVIGLPMKAWAHLTPGDWNAELRWATDYPTRLGFLLECEAIIALDGGVGTLSEMSLAWAVGQTESVAPCLILLGNRWHQLVHTFREQLVIGEEDIGLLHVVDTPEEALSVLQNRRGERRAPGARG